MRSWIFICLLMMAVIVPSAQASSTTENLVNHCKMFKSYNDARARDQDKSLTVPEAFAVAYCGTFFYAFAQGVLKEAASGMPRSATGMCMPESSASEWPLVFLKYMDNHPNRLHEEAADTVWDALVEAYPCKRPAK
jgi:hypothetical protein